MRILFIGDVVGKVGIGALSSFLPALISRWNVDVAIVNGENSADTGFGITRDTYRAIRDAGADAVTLGNHSWNRKEALEVADQESRLIRPIHRNRVCFLRIHIRTRQQHEKAERDEQVS